MRLLLLQLIFILAIIGGIEAQGWISCLTQQLDNGNCASQLEEARSFVERNPNWIQKLENNRNNATENLIECEHKIGIGSDDEMKTFLAYAIKTSNCPNSLRKIELKSATELEECNNGASKIKILAIVFIACFLFQSVALLVVSILLCRGRKLTGKGEIPK